MGFRLALALLFLILEELIGVLGAAVICAVVVVAWSVFNKRVLTIGLIKSDMQSYFTARSKGTNHEDAIDRVIGHRYPFSQEKQDSVKSMFDALPFHGDEEEDLKMIVYAICCYEAGKPPKLDRTDRILVRIEDSYDSISNEYAKDANKNR